MASRRAFLGGLLAAGVAPRRSWADAGDPAFLSAGRHSDGRHLLCGLDVAGEVAFTLPLPARGHAAAAHPTAPEAVAFARRPGTFAIVLDCATGRETARLSAPPGRHFYGHGTFSRDGALLFTTENDFAAARGMIGVWDARRGYARIAEFPSGGVGPHDLRSMPDGRTMVVANGGIETHPETGRAKLNLPSMRSTLTYLDLSGRVLERVALDAPLRRNSIRHLAVAEDGKVGIAMQWQGDATDDVPLVGTHRRGGPLRLIAPSHAAPRDLRGYVGSIAIAPDAGTLAITSPRGGVLRVHDLATGAEVSRVDLADVCGLAPNGAGYLATSGTGEVLHVASGGTMRGAPGGIAWDNHLVPI
ncbi:MAG: DUF1513 domain-containing protein [Shimia sp.]